MEDLMKNLWKKPWGFGLVFIVTAVLTLTACPTEVEEPSKPTVTLVEVSPAAASVNKGGRRQFSAAVTGENDPATTVTWSIDEADKASGTGIDETGLLTVAVDEILPALTIRATSTLDDTKSGFATVTVTVPDIYTIIFHVNGGTWGSPPLEEYNVESPEIELPENITKEFHAFTGWFSDAGLTTAVTVIAQGSTGNKEFYAGWEVNVAVYTITFHDNGGIWDSPPPSQYFHGSAEISLPENITKAGYAFTGWFSDAGLTTAVTAIVQGSTGNKEFYAGWNKILTGTVTISGTEEVGQILTTASSSLDPGSGNAYQWKRDGADIPGANASTYQLTANDSGTKISVVVSRPPNGGSLSGGPTGYISTPYTAPLFPAYIPSNKVAPVWDMEHLPKNLGTTEGWTADRPGGEGVAAGRVAWLSEDGKGFGNSKALKWQGISMPDWGDGRETSVNLASDTTAVRNWSDKAALWVWIDTTGITTTNSNFKLKINDVYWTGSVTIYDNTGTPQTITVENEWGDLKIPSYTGWVRIPLRAFSAIDLSNIQTLGFNCQTAAGTVYFDHFMVEAKPVYPSYPSYIPSNKVSPVWDMESLPANLGTAGWTEDTGGGEGVAAGKVAWLSEDGKGFGGSWALKWQGINVPGWADGRFSHVILTNDTTAVRNWSDKAALWVWIDATDITTDLPVFKFKINDIFCNAGTGITIYDSAGTPQTITVQNEWGNLNMPAYKGWVRIPLSFTGLDLSNIQRFGFDYAGQTGTVYFDHFLVESAE
jgi:uncharacterized repeat protein (TIGR02543 family)